MTNAERSKQALEAIKKAIMFLASAAHDYELAGMDREFDLTYDVLVEANRVHGAVKPKREKKARA